MCIRDSLEDLDGSWGAGLAISQDLSTMVVATGYPKLNVYSIDWNNNVPSFTLQYVIEGYTNKSSIVNQIHFDYAGNLFFADAKLGAVGIALPKDARSVATPSKYLFDAGQATGVNDVNANKTVAGVKYYNTLGVASSTPFEGINIVVTTYTDGTHSSAKVIK